MVSLLVSLSWTSWLRKIPIHRTILFSHNRLWPLCAWVPTVSDDWERGIGRIKFVHHQHWSRRWWRISMSSGARGRGFTPSRNRSLERAQWVPFTLWVLFPETECNVSISDFLSVPPQTPTIEGYSNGSLVKVPHEQKTLDLTCVAENGKPAATIKWLRNGEDIGTSMPTQQSVQNLSNKLQNAKSILTITPKQEDNEALFTCQANSEALQEALETTVQLSVMCE